MTPQQIEAMKLALECAERCEAIDGMYSWSATITAIEEALAEHAMHEVQKLGQEIEQEPVAWVYPEGLEALKAGKPWTAYGTRQEPNNTALYLSPQPDISPYAWVTFTPYGDEDDVWYENPEGQLLEGWTYKPLYDITPPQRTWVGLNDDEIDYLIHLAYTGDEEFVQTIEAKLKEKNLPCIKPKWIGLTEKEHTDVAVECGCMSADWVFYGAAVERKLKERNT